MMEPMEARLVDELPTGADWWYEPKWDGFRCLASREGKAVTLMSKAGKPLTRYFPEVADAVHALDTSRVLLDGELVVPVHGALSFDNLLQRIHPAASRVRLLATQTPAWLIAFDLLVDGRASLVERPLEERRQRLEAFIDRYARGNSTIHLSPITTRLAVAERWLGSDRTGLDGVVAKRRDLPYQPGERTGMEKVKHVRAADCVVGGFRYATRGTAVGSLLLGLYDDAGLLDHVGFVSSFTRTERATLISRVSPLTGGAGFTGRAPGGPSRWSTERSAAWIPLEPTLVVEVAYDHFSDGRFRHGTGFRRWRPDKAPHQCTMEQLPREGHSALRLLRRG
jgi:ATP-dependent DNA ligase